MEKLGLAKGTVQLKSHDTDWGNLFRQEKALLLKTFPEVILEVSHGGSTAIPTIPAKPILDIFAAVPSLYAAESIKDDLKKIGYEYRGADGVPERVLYVKSNEQGVTHHLQLAERTSREWTNHILIREYYLQHPEAAQEYAQLKATLAARYPKDRVSYSKGKDAFIKSVIEKAHSARQNKF